MQAVLAPDTERGYLVPRMEQGESVKGARLKAGLSQQELAESVGTFQQTIDKIERGIVKHSRYLPGILERLGLVSPRQREQNSPKADKETGSLPLVGERDLPVFGAAEGGGGAVVVSNDPVDYVRRPAPLAQVKDGYGLIVVGDSMAPEFKPGDTALVHPHLPPLPGEACVFTATADDGEAKITIKSFIRSTVTHWHVEQWNPPKKFSLSRKEWQKCHRTVGKYSRR